ncbi:MAG TPA: hypothetical protein EYH54_02765 [Nautiliaceae bacterium]|nr:hypothetical protein [Nautiliaceae bacterium]
MPRLIPAILKIEFSEYNEKLKEEFDTLGSETEDPIGQFIKLAKARGETKETDPVLLELLIALHRKVDELSAFVKNEKKELLPLDKKSEIVKIGFDHFEIRDSVLEKNKKYYGRIDLPVFPPREVGVIFKGENEKLAKILLMHERDIKDYNAFLMARERAIIREMKAKND